ncbi:flagellar motor switch protein FliG [Amaricoccus macauensis]|uniref:flagellar motor switch protein FliG n=1 Tax=Amaricoccus macauensis TaxID=57001 RepID=UPI003C7EC210
MSEQDSGQTALVTLPDRPDALKLARKSVQSQLPSTELAEQKQKSAAAHLSLIQKAAIVLTAIGPEMASTVLQDISEEDMERIVRTLGQLGKIGQDVLDAVIIEFLEQLTSGLELSGGARVTRELLSGLIPDAEIDRILGTLPQTKGRGVWERLNAAPIKALATFLAAEHPQTVAVIVTELRADIAASVLAEIDRDFAQQVVLRLARVPSMDKRVSMAMQQAIERDFLVTLQSSMSKRRPAELIAGLMNNISSEVRDAFMEFLENKNEVLAAEVQRTMFTFEDIAVRLNSRDVAAVLREMDEEELLKALNRGVAQESPSVEFLLSSLPRRLAERFREDLDAMQPVPLKEGEAAQIELSKIILDMSKRGTINLLDIELPT